MVAGGGGGRPGSEPPLRPLRLVNGLCGDMLRRGPARTPSHEVSLVLGSCPAALPRALSLRPFLEVLPLRGVARRQSAPGMLTPPLSVNSRLCATGLVLFRGHG